MGAKRRGILSVIRCYITEHSKIQGLKTVYESQLCGLGIQAGLRRMACCYCMCLWLGQLEDPRWPVTYIVLQRDGLTIPGLGGVAEPFFSWCWFSLIIWDLGSPPHGASVSWTSD